MKVSKPSIPTRFSSGGERTTPSGKLNGRREFPVLWVLACSKSGRDADPVVLWMTLAHLAFTLQPRDHTVAKATVFAISKSKSASSLNAQMAEVENIVCCDPFRLGTSESPFSRIARYTSRIDVGSKLDVPVRLISCSPLPMGPRCNTVLPLGVWVTAIWLTLAKS